SSSLSRTTSLPFSFFTHAAPTAPYPLSLHDALPIFSRGRARGERVDRAERARALERTRPAVDLRRRPALDDATAREHDEVERGRSEEHTSELQSQSNLVCRLLLEKKKTQESYHTHR